MKIRICCNVFTIYDEIDEVAKKNNKSLKVLVQKDTNNTLSIIFDEKEDIKIQIRKKLQEVLGTNFFHLEQVYTLGDKKFFEDGYIDIIYVAIINTNQIKKISSEYEFVDVNIVPTKSIKYGKQYYEYKTITESINNNVEYYHIIKCEDIKLEKEIVKLIISLKFLSSRVKNTGIIFYMLNKTFILDDVKVAYELITGEKVDRSNFRKKYKKYCESTGNKSSNKTFRPAQVYKCNIKNIETLYR